LFYKKHGTKEFGTKRKQTLKGIYVCTNSLLALPTKYSGSRAWHQLGQEWSTVSN